MNSRSTESDLKRDLRGLLRSMDFVSRHPALKRDGPEAERFANIYQQLGMAWEFLALQCRHRNGWRKLRDGKFACNVCGLIRGAKEPWLLFPRTGKKTIGRRAIPKSKRTFPNRKAATIVNDMIDFHGAKLNVEVLNQHRSNSRWFRKHDWTISADRLVRLEESGIEVRSDTHLITVELRKHKKGEMPPYSHFVWELPRKSYDRTVSGCYGKCWEGTRNECCWFVATLLPILLLTNSLTINSVTDVADFQTYVSIRGNN